MLYSFFKFKNVANSYLIFNYNLGKIAGEILEFLDGTYQSLHSTENQFILD